METLKRNPLMASFIASIVVFNLLFFLNDYLIRTALSTLNVYDKCPPGTLYCDAGSYTMADDIIMGLFVLSLFASAITGAVLLSKQIDKLWNKSHRPKKSQRQAPRRPKL